MRHHIGDQKQHDHNRHQRDDGRVERRANQFGLECLLLFQVVGQTLQHQPKVAALLAGADDGDKNTGKLVRVLRQRLGKSRAAIDLSAQGRYQMALGVALRLIRQGGQGAFQGQSRGHQARDLARPDAQAGGVEHAPLHAVSQSWAPLAGSEIGAGTYRLHAQRHHGLAAQHAAGRSGRIGVDHTLAGLPVGGQGFK